MSRPGKRQLAKWGRKGGYARAEKLRREKVDAVQAGREALERYQGDPIGFIRALVDPETGEPFELYAAEETFLREVLTLEDGATRYPEAVFSAPKKSGKTTVGALARIYTTVVVGGRFAEGYCVANDYEQAAGRVFKYATRIIKASPLLKCLAICLSGRITWKHNDGFIQAIGANYA